MNTHLSITVDEDAPLADVIILHLFLEDEINVRGAKCTITGSVGQEVYYVVLHELAETIEEVQLALQEYAADLGTMIFIHAEALNGQTP